jgi:hypothetical protein
MTRLKIALRFAVPGSVPNLLYQLSWSIREATVPAIRLPLPDSQSLALSVLCRMSELGASDCSSPKSEPSRQASTCSARNFLGARQIRATLNSIVEFDLKFLPVPVTAYSQTSTLRSR